MVLCSVFITLTESLSPAWYAGESNFVLKNPVDPIKPDKKLVGTSPYAKAQPYAQ